MRQRDSPFAAFGCCQFTSEFNFKYKRLPEFSLSLAWLVRLEFALMFSLLHASSIAIASDTDMVMVVSLFNSTR